MITQKNIDEARLVEARAKEQYGVARLNLDAFEKFIAEINSGLWDPANGQVPSTGPFTVAQAAMINVNLEEDYSYPIVFTRDEIWNIAGVELTSLQEKVKEFAENLEAAKTTSKELENEYIEEKDRAAEVAASSPAVIAAKENIEAAKIKAASDREKAEERSETRRTIFQGLLGIAVVAVIIIVVAKVLK